MAQVKVPGVAQVVFKGRFGSQPWVVVHHWRLGTSTADWNTANIGTLAQTAYTAYGAHLKAHASTSINLDSVTATDIGALVPAIAVSTGPAIPGTGAGAVANSAMCAVVQNKINVRYKGGHPRSYWPLGVNTDVANEFQWNNTFLTNLTTDMVAFISQIVTALPGSGATAANHCVPLYVYEIVDDSLHHKYRRIRVDVKGVFTVASYSVMQKFGTQRRRLAA